MRSGKLKDGWTDEEGLSLSFVSGTGAVGRTHSDEGPLEVQQLRLGLSEVSVVAAQLKHPEHQHQRTVLRVRRKNNEFVFQADVTKC